jgi:large subunit ribosomal protein L29
MTKANEIQDMDNSALIDFIDTSRQELFGLRFQNATGELENTARMRTTRQDLARGLTEARARGLSLTKRTKS